MFNFGWVARPQVMSFYLVSLDAFFILFTSGITNLSLYKHSYLIRLTNLSNTVKTMTILIRLIKYLHLFSRCKRHTKIAACKQALKREAPLRGFHTSVPAFFSGPTFLSATGQSLERTTIPRRIGFRRKALRASRTTMKWRAASSSDGNQMFRYTSEFDIKWLRTRMLFWAEFSTFRWLLCSAA